MHHGEKVVAIAKHNLPIADSPKTTWTRSKPEWERIFGERMPRSFEVSPAQVPILRRCIEQRSKQPLNDYVLSIPDDIVYSKDGPPDAFVPHAPEGKRILGFLKDHVGVPDEAVIGEDAEIESMFYGTDDCESQSRPTSQSGEGTNQ